MIVRCVGTNDNLIDHNSFRRLFVTECQAIGRITRMIDGGGMLLAEVENGN